MIECITEDQITLSIAIVRLVVGERCSRYFSNQRWNIQCIRGETHAKRNTAFDIQVFGHQHFQIMHILLRAQFMSSAGC